MINYGVVYPQAILIFVITLLYSVIQPLIVVFGAIYFGAAYVVYKYKLLFGVLHTLLFLISPSSNERYSSVLQALRIPRSSLANHFYAPLMGDYYLPHLHVWDLYLTKVLCDVNTPRAFTRRHTAVGLENR
jgi:hypothetical protein